MQVHWNFMEYLISSAVFWDRREGALSSHCNIGRFLKGIVLINSHLVYCFPNKNLVGPCFELMATIPLREQTVKILIIAITLARWVAEFALNLPVLLIYAKWWCEWTICSCPKPTLYSIHHKKWYSSFYPKPNTLGRGKKPLECDGCDSGSLILSTSNVCFQKGGSAVSDP